METSLLQISICTSAAPSSPLISTLYLFCEVVMVSFVAVSVKLIIVSGVVQDLPVSASTASKESKKDPKHLKRPQTPFLLWAKDYRVQVCPAFLVFNMLHYRSFHSVSLDTNGTNGL